MDKELVIAGKGIHGHKACAEERDDRRKKEPVDAARGIAANEIVIESG